MSAPWRKSLPNYTAQGLADHTLTRKVGSEHRLRHIYGLRNRVERCFNRLKNSRRIATRYDKTADSYTGFLHIASIRL
ncbi:transposase [Nitratireductor sp. GISD-1A_MAKvit]|uniref:transposase n=1 Tax=Nitratireductor sp. GISD-1A_MAKvit TaxID=3234198 RepID=UPI003465C78A